MPVPWRVLELAPSLHFFLGCPCLVQMHEVEAGLNKTQSKAENNTDLARGAPHNLDEGWGLYVGASRWVGLAAGAAAAAITLAVPRLLRHSLVRPQTSPLPASGPRSRATISTPNSTPSPGARLKAPAAAASIPSSTP